MFPTEIPGDLYDDEEDEPHLYPMPEQSASFPQGKKPLSGSVRTADSRVPKSFVLWPQELGVYCDGANPPKYDSLSLEQFVQGFIATSLIAPRSQLVHRFKHLQEIMEDVQLRDWPKVRAYHKVFMHHIEQGTAHWAGCSELKASLKMRYIYMAGEPTTSKDGSGVDGATKGRKKPPSTKPGSTYKSTMEATVPCEDFNSPDGCQEKSSHDGLKHCCSHCKKAVKQIYNHSKQSCYWLKATGN
jgi:hypothetical protein